MDRIDRVVKSYIERHNIKTIPAFSFIKENWHLFVGDFIAKKSKVSYLNRGVLTVYVFNSVIHHELALRKSEIIKKINEVRGNILLTDLEISLKSEENLDFEDENFEKEPQIELTEKECKWAKAESLKIKDKDIRKIYYDILISFLKLKHFTEKKEKIINNFHKHL